MHKRYLTAGALLGGLGVILGAFGAHKLKEMVPPETVGTFQTGVQYQMYHAIAFVFTGILYERFASGALRWAGICFGLGILLFSGSLYVLTLVKATDTVGLSKLGIITPFGGSFFIAGWLLLAVAVSRSRK